MSQQVYYPAGTLADADHDVVITPQTAGWDHTGLRVLRLPAGGTWELITGTTELAVLPLSGSCTVECDGHRFGLEGRDDVFSRVTDFAYLPIDCEARISSSGGGEFALPFAEASNRLDPAYGPAGDVPIEVRGAGQFTRQITNFLEPDAFPADRLIAVEVLTPEGNWSSYPPHKHDEDRPGEVINEEIYYFRLSAEGGFGLHHLYTPDRDIDATERIEHGDVFLIPRGYHGPSVAAPGYDLYYLNAMAGPGDERSMANCLDPAHAWVWEELRPERDPDPRLPMTTAKGRP